MACNGPINRSMRSVEKKKKYFRLDTNLMNSDRLSDNEFHSSDQQSKCVTVHSGHHHVSGLSASPMTFDLFLSFFLVFWSHCGTMAPGIRAVLVIIITGT